MERIFRGDRLFVGLGAACGGALLAALVGLVVAVVCLSMPSLRALGVSPLLSASWEPARGAFGMLALFWGTAVSSLLALAMAVPLGMGVALFVTELGPRVLGRAVTSVLEVVTAIPSVVYGLWALHVLVPMVRRGLFGGATAGGGLLTAALVLAVMTLPAFVLVVKDVLLTVPTELRESALALGATPWEIVRHVVLPHAFRGVVGAGLLALCRALGEAMAVVAVIGGNAEISASLRAPSSTVASVLAREFAGAASTMHVAALAELAGILLFVTLGFNVAARALLARYGRTELA